MKREQRDGEHEYLVTPMEFDIKENEAHSTYDTFIKLRDTIVYSSKFYADNAGRSLIIGIKTDGKPTGTIEIWNPNIFKQRIEPDGAETPVIKGTYIKEHTDGCEIVLSGRYKIIHKEQLEGLQNTSITRVTGYVLQKKLSGLTIQRAVFDWSWDTVGEIKRITPQGYIECDLEKGDILELHLVDQNGIDIPTSLLQRDSNWWSIEYIDLPYND